MDNLKINLRLGSPLRMDRFTTIDSILCALYVANKNGGKQLSRSELDNLDFLAKNRDGYSGSIWFVPKEARVSIENRAITKKPEYEYLNDHRSRKVTYSEGSGEFKAYKIWFETLKVDEIYFYARGDKSVIEDLLKNLKYVGKKTSIGLGRVKSFSVEIIDEDKSTFLDANTQAPSRPLSTRSYDIMSDRVAFYRSKVPYWDKECEACYMPNSSLIENPTISGKKIDNEHIPFISGCRLAYDVLSSDTLHWKTAELDKFATKSDEIVSGGKRYKCAVTGEYSDKGILYAKLEKTMGITFTDYAFVNDTGFLSEELIWTLRNGVNSRGDVKTLTLGFHLIDASGITYVMGANKTKTISEAVRGATTPFNLALKTTTNNQHTVFKSKNATSKELIPCQYGNEKYYFGISEAEQCLKEAQELCSKYPIYKNQLIPSPQISEPFMYLSKEARARENEIYGILSDFYKKYDKGVRAGAFFLTIGAKK